MLRSTCQGLADIQHRATPVVRSPWFTGKATSEPLKPKASFRGWQAGMPVSSAIMTGWWSGRLCRPGLRAWGGSSPSRGRRVSGRPVSGSTSTQTKARGRSASAVGRAGRQPMAASSRSSRV